jgi:hypothetical protein
MLTNHRHIAVPPEGGFIVRLGWKYDRVEFVSENQIDKFLIDLFLSPNIRDWEVDNMDLKHRFLKKIPCFYSQLIEEIYRSYSDYKFSKNKNRWGDKTTWYLNYLPQIRKYFPNAQFIHLVRDCRAVASSYKGVAHLPDNVLNSSLDWLWSINEITRFGSRIGNDQYFQVRYEDLVEDPVHELTNICTFLNEEFDKRMLDYWMENRSYHLEPERHMAWKKLTLEKVTDKRVSIWKSTLNSKEIRQIETLTVNEMESFGYHLDNDPIIFLSRIPYLFLRCWYFLTRFTKRKLREIKYRLLRGKNNGNE